MHRNIQSLLRLRYTRFMTTYIMLGAAFLCSSLVLAHALQDHYRFSAENFGASGQSRALADYKFTCEKIAQSISPKSHMFYPGKLQVFGLRFVSCTDPAYLDSSEFNFDISHWANTSSQVPVCSVEPGTPDDVGLVVNLTLLPSIVAIFLTFNASTAPGDCLG